MSRPALIDKLMQAGEWLLKPGLVPVDDVTIKRNQTVVYVALDALIRQGGGLAVGQDKRIYVDFSLMPTDAFEDLLKSIRVPIWLTKNLTIYVATTGSNTLDEGRGLTEDKPFATLRAALDYVSDTYNLSRYNITIKLAAGDYGRSAITLPSYTASTGEIYIQGAASSAPESTKIGHVNLNYSNNYHLIDLTCKPADINVATAGVAPSAGFIYLQNTVIDISETTVSNNANLMGISTSLTGTAYINATNGDVPNGVKIKVADTFSSPNIILSSAGGNILAYADVKVEGTATLGSCFASARQLGKIQFLKSASSNPGRAPVVKLADGASVTGKRYTATLNGIIDIGGGGPDFFPGTVPGTTSTGGQYE